MDYSMSYQCLHFEEYGRRHLIHTYNPTYLLLLMRIRFGNDVYMVIIQYCLTMMAIGSCSITSSRPKNKRLFLSSCENSHKTSFFACSLGVSRSWQSSRSGKPSGRPRTIRICALIECWCYTPVHFSQPCFWTPQKCCPMTETRKADWKEKSPY